MKIGIAQTMFSRYDMGKVAKETIEKESDHTIEMYTVPGVKDLPVACKKLIEEFNCDIVVACGWVGPEPVDKTCGHEASSAIQQVQLMTNTHILEVFIHEDEGTDEEDLKTLAYNRTMKHAKNALALLNSKDELAPMAGTGQRQGRDDAGALQ